MRVAQVGDHSHASRPESYLHASDASVASMLRRREKGGGVPQWAHGRNNPVSDWVICSRRPCRSGGVLPTCILTRVVARCCYCRATHPPPTTTSSTPALPRHHVPPSSTPLKPPCAMTDAGASPAMAPVAAPSPAASAHGQQTPGPRQMQSPMVLDDDKKRELIANMDQARVNALRKVSHLL